MDKNDKAFAMVLLGVFVFAMIFPWLLKAFFYYLNFVFGF
jgi:hypothetical protein